MKVVLFCGGQGLRLRDHEGGIPKPMVPVGSHPILWQVMRYYAHFGHKDFILCLGYKPESIKEYFLKYDERMSNDFVMSDGGRRIEIYNHDIEDWSITFADTGLEASIGQRLQAIRPYLEGEERFLANYSDGITDLPLDRYIDYAAHQDKVACFLSVKPTASFHVVSTDGNGRVTKISPVEDATRINCGYFVLKQEIFDYMRPEDDLVTAPFQRLIEADQLATMVYDGFWECMDTFKDKQKLEEMVRRGDTPWRVWA
jgi:glucose-1-phosphate cytidylyltransferase